MSFDNTYNTNRFKLPLFQKHEGFQFLAEGIRQLNEKHDIPLPEVVITDYDQQMKAGLDSQFPDSQQQICTHHINSNVLLSAKRKWKDAKEDGDSDDSSSGSGQTQTALTSGDIEAVLSVEGHGDPSLQNDRTTPVPHNYRGVLEMWKYVAFTQTKEDYEMAWVRLCEEFNDQQAILTYLHKTYLPERDFIDSCSQDEVLTAWACSNPQNHAGGLETERVCGNSPQGGHTVPGTESHGSNAKLNVFWLQSSLAGPGHVKVQ
ncbi:hypothetical protein HIM_10509 [Hirsutella minnesotensis 3608]|uniref:MULE transposase domain-containing protein n=1 Tax=Hirsutella minnesotensis 3608 TaxID=1043627 RepID=A0A0F7ZG16_9HYPO|nr:hypothetical protein HIM_10509 [Hirsutella minnesotensis 3608]